MGNLTPGKIFLADQRGFTESNISSRHSTFNFEKYTNEQSQPSGTLFVCNDESIAAGKLIFFLSKEDSYQIFFPITGGLDIVQGGKEFSVNKGRIQILNVGKGEVIDISNPYPNDVINYLQIGITTDLFLLRASEMLYHFDFDKNRNQLIEVISNPQKLSFKLSAGSFAVGAELVYKLRDKDYKLFCFVIDGAFEIGGRSLHARDGLALWNLEEVEIKALNNNAIILVLEHV